MSVSAKHLDFYKQFVSLSNDVAQLRNKLDAFRKLCEDSDMCYCEPSYLDDDRSLTVIHQELLDSIFAIESGDYDEA